MYRYTPRNLTAPGAHFDTTANYLMGGNRVGETPKPSSLGQALMSIVDRQQIIESDRAHLMSLFKFNIAPEFSADAAAQFEQTLGELIESGTITDDEANNLRQSMQDGYESMAVLVLGELSKCLGDSSVNRVA